MAADARGRPGAERRRVVGRVVAELRRIGELENTLIFVTADNGASGEGGLAGTFNETYVLNGLQTPFDLYQVRGDEFAELVSGRLRIFVASTDSGSREPCGR